MIYLSKLRELVDRRTGALLAGVLVVAALALTVHALSRPVADTGPDGNVYERLGAEAAASDHLLGCGNFKRSYWAPGWITTIAVVYRVTGRRPHAIRFFLIAVALATGWLVFAMARRLAGPCAGIAAVCLFLFSTLVFRFTSYYQYEIPFAFLTASAGFILFFVPAGQKGAVGKPLPAYPRGGVLSAGVVIAVGALISPRVLALLPLVILCFRLQSGWRRALASTAVLLIGVWLVLLPWGVRNHNCFGEWIFTTTNGGVNLYLGNNAHNTGSGLYLPPVGVRPPHDVQESGEWIKEAVKYSVGEPGRTLRRVLVKGLRFWNPHYGDQALVLVLFVIGWARLIRSRRHADIRTPLTPAMVWILAAPFVFMLVHMVFYVQVRYMIPALPMVTVVAGAGLCGWRPQSDAQDINTL
jgi:4-amino-4-deoxy-L-arabinose transferase-like glycosyltransferase